MLVASRKFGFAESAAIGSYLSVLLMDSDDSLSALTRCDGS
jgi:hypothetical protein